jgi:hypothetical protein
MALEGDAVVLAETVTNQADEPVHFVWGHHCVVGPPFLEAGCRLRVAATTLTTRQEAWEDTDPLERGQRATWPHGRLRSGSPARPSRSLAQCAHRLPLSQLGGPGNP